MYDTPDKINVDLLEAAVLGLTARPKAMSPKWFYDERGSNLFEHIARLPEYYPTRTEAAILREHADDVARLFAATPLMVEIGSGASVKTRILLDALSALETYAPLDISREMLQKTARRLRDDYPTLDVVPLIGDFMESVSLPPALEAIPKLLFFPGSTIGNLDRDEAHQLLERLAAWPNVDAFILGADLVKDTETLVRAYNDDAGVTAAFNKNLLVRLNRECGCTFDLSAFRHEARWNEEFERIEMHLVSTRALAVRVGEHLIDFAPGESLHTENSHKFTQQSLEALADASGWIIDQYWTDSDAMFALTVLRPNRPWEVLTGSSRLSQTARSTVTIS